MLAESGVGTKSANQLTHTDKKTDQAGSVPDFSVMPPKVKRVPKRKRGRPTTGEDSTSRKRQACDNDDITSSEDSEVTKQPQKRQGPKGKKRNRDPVESVEEDSDEEPNAEAVDLGVSDPDTDIEQQRSDLEDRHQAKLREEVAPKRETTRDLDLMFSERLKVNFKKNNKATLMTGRWCLTCR
ncbi:hypothetical protein EDB84DRAFT_1444553 [Lactarius hengduanensis]|nr:hypothetical protein EDB84DRAFT_1444553 [Lactarius hengduanensis]